MDLSAYLTAAVAGVPLSFVVFGLVWWYGQIAPAFFTGWRQFAASMATGAVLGVGYFVSATQPPASGVWWEAYGYWFGAGMYGVGLGVLASAGYDQARDLVRSAIDRHASALRAGLRTGKAGEDVQG
jgi:hypothetical protein